MLQFALSFISLQFHLTDRRSWIHNDRLLVYFLFEFPESSDGVSFARDSSLAPGVHVTIGAKFVRFSRVCPFLSFIPKFGPIQSVTYDPCCWFVPECRILGNSLLISTSATFQAIPTVKWSSRVEEFCRLLNCSFRNRLIFANSLLWRKEKRPSMM